MRVILSISAIENSLARRRAELAYWRGIAAVFDPGTRERQRADEAIGLCETSLAADTHLVAFLRRRVNLYATFGLPPPPDVEA